MICISGAKIEKGAICEDVAPTLTAEAELTKNVPIVLTEKRFFEWHEDDRSVTLREKSGSYGGQRSAYCRDKCGAICARDFKGVGNEYVMEGKLIVEYR